MMLIERQAAARRLRLDDGDAGVDRGAQQAGDGVKQDASSDLPAEALAARAKRILVVDDEAMILRSLQRVLAAAGYEVVVAASGLEALELVREKQPDLVLLDLAMPGIDGLAVCRELRQWSAAPIIVVSAYSEERFKVHALDLGADDYLTKPFGSDELLAHMRACLRRSAGWQIEGQQEEGHLLASEDGYLTMDLSNHRVMAGSRQVRLTPKEFDLLHQLMAAPGRVLTHHLLLKTIWGPEYIHETEYLRVFIRQLRRKIERDPAHPRYILTEPGVGYLFRVQ